MTPPLVVRSNRRAGTRWCGFATRACVLVAAAVLSLAGGTSAHPGSPADAFGSMADAERAFARAAAARGIRAAFLEFLDDDAVGFAPALGRAKDQWNARPESADPLATSLAWDPRTGGVAGDGMLGWLSGPYVLVPSGDASKTAHGCYFSIWRRTASSPWRVYLDLGISTPGPCAFQTTFEPYPGSAGRGRGTRESLLQSDRALAARPGDPGAFAAVADDHVLVHRDGRQPFIGLTAARAAIGADRRSWTLTQVDGAVASSGDLGFTYGRVEASGGREQASYYVRVWRLGGSGAWRLVFDTVSR